MTIEDLFSPKDSALRKAACLALSLLEDGGFEAYFVGGFVRDTLLNRPINDADLTTNAPYESMVRLFENAGYTVHRTGEKHGTVTVVVEGFPLEITRYRTDGAYEDHRHPTQVTFVSTLEEDLARRDFTINAMAYNPRIGALVDYHNGANDLRRGIIRCVGDPRQRFQEDALRILRALRFASQLNFTLEPETSLAIHENVELLGSVSAERLYSEFTKLLCGQNPFPILMEYSDVVFQLIPELKESWKFDQMTPYHKYDVYEHIAHTVENIPATPLCRWIALMHDAGKPAHFTRDEKGVGHFKRHAITSELLARQVAERFKMPRDFTEDLLLIVRRHDDVVEETPRAVKRMLFKLGGRPDLFEVLCDMKRADTLSQADRCLPRLEMVEHLRAIAADVLKEDEAFSLKQLDLSGEDLIALGLKPGPQFSQLLNAALEAVIDEACPNEKEALISYLGLKQ